MLESVRVLSMAEQYPGPFATSILADLGADVVLFERTAGGDPSRRFPEFFDALNRGKRSVAADLKTPEGKMAFAQLARTADVVLEGFRPGVAARLGVGADDVHRINPRAVYLSISGFGQDGPYRDRPGHDLSYQAHAGALGVDASHIQPGGLSLGDLAAAMYATVAAVGGLYERERTGRGPVVDVSITDALVSWMTTSAVPVVNGAEQGALEAEPGYGVFRTSDGGRVALAVAHEDHFWRRLAEATGVGDVAHLDGRARLADAEALRARISSAIEGAPLATWLETLDAHDVPHARVNAPGDLPDDPHIQARGLFVGIAGASARRYLRTPLVIDGVAPAPRRRTPDLGEHTAEVLAEWGESG
ncbi:CaiB/BaiF CoA transferase family protein [Microbacterium sp. CPCC 204701]|uniref:CaiB/BaiF CoA transferase family protein n=1 Tax=Microbacterium sp. CPCC 204701 TaxID=2493084 RepID=UPI001F0BF478|nr:CaiB/BaiF CoA-transferase family protein [Microbacterium sp. CPCC 204701]